MHKEKPHLAFMAAALIAAITSARAAESGQSLGDRLALDPLQWELGNYEIRLGGTAAGALFTSSASTGPAIPGGEDSSGVTAALQGNIRVQRTLDTGMVLGARGDFLLYHDDLSGDNYDNDTVQRAYFFVQTGFGRLDIGQQDGAGYALGLVGPIVDENISLEARNVTLFRQPAMRKDFAGIFPQVTSVQSSSNFAKINYVSPRLFGIQVGASFTPNTVRSPLPWTGNPSDDPDQQHALWEIATSYTGYFSNVALGLSAAYAHGRLKNRTPGFENLQDWALGAQLAYTVSDIKLSLGGAYRGTNAYLLDVTQARSNGSSHLVHISAMAEKGSWLLGGEYSNADVSGPVDFEMTSYQVAAGYRVNANLQLSFGWQWHYYRRDAGTFFNGSPMLDLNTGFLTLSYAL